MWVGKIKGGLSQYILGLMNFNSDRILHAFMCQPFKPEDRDMEKTTGWDFIITQDMSGWCMNPSAVTA